MVTLLMIVPCCGAYNKLCTTRFYQIRLSWSLAQFNRIFSIWFCSFSLFCLLCPYQLPAGFRLSESKANRPVHWKQLEHKWPAVKYRSKSKFNERVGRMCFRCTYHQMMCFLIWEAWLLPSISVAAWFGNLQHWSYHSRSGCVKPLQIPTSFPNTSQGLPSVYIAIDAVSHEVQCNAD